MKKKIIFTLFIIALLQNPLFANTNNTHYDPSIVPKKMTVQEKKQRFFALLVPAVNKVYQELEENYLEAKKLIQKNPQDKKLLSFMQSYHAKDGDDLLKRMKPHPKSITLAQSATESAWATSRFFRVAKNIFGVWSYNKDEPRVPASKKRGNKTIYVKKYSSIEDSIRNYYKILATGQAFAKFRDEKMKTNDPYKLVKYLDKYSERGEAYTKGLASLIRYNKLTKYDK